MTSLDYYDTLVWIVNSSSQVTISEKILLVTENGSLKLIKKDEEDTK